MTPKYHIDVFWSGDDRCWIADVPDLKSCAAHGETPEGVVAEVQVAIEGCLEVAREHGDMIPEPRYRPMRAAAA